MKPSHRVAFASAISTLLFLCGNAEAQSTDQSNASIRKAYQISIRCMLVNFHFSSIFEKSGDSANAKLFRDRSERSFKSAYGFAYFLKIPNSQVDSDMVKATEPELKKLMTDKNYQVEMINFCKSHGHME